MLHLRSKEKTKHTQTFGTPCPNLQEPKPWWPKELEVAIYPGRRDHGRKYISSAAIHGPRQRVGYWRIYYILSNKYKYIYIYIKYVYATYIYNI